jgi:hypothetical protein
VSFLEQASLAEEQGLPPPKLGRRVAIYGGGNTAMDAARTARRLGVEEAMIIYRRDRDHMPAHAFEADEAEEEGIKINWLRTIRQLDSTNIEVEVMALDAEGKPVPTGQFETLEADSLILALGQEVDLSVLESIPGVRVNKEGVVQVGENLMTDVPGLFAGGDMVPSERTVTIATGHGKKAARHMDAWLRGRLYHKPLYPRWWGRSSCSSGSRPMPRPAASRSNRPRRGTTLARSSADWTRRRPATRRRAATPAATASSATAAMAAAPSRPSPSWGRVWGIRWMPNAAPAVVPAMTSAPATPSSCANRRSPNET